MSESGQIITVSGPMPADQMGLTLPHEHPFCKLHQSRYRFDFPDQYDDMDVVADEVSAFGALGGQTLVDATPPDIGRSPERILELSQRTGVNIIIGCGWYRENYYSPEELIERRSVEDLAEELIREIEDGIDDTGMRPGVIGEIGSEKSWVSPSEERVLRACARASISTGLAIGPVHAIGAVPPAQLTILESEGVDISRVAIAHRETYPHLPHLVDILERGAYVQFDNCGQYQGMPNYEKQVLDVILELLHRGYEDQIHLSQDTCKMGQFRIHGGPGFVYVLETFLPLLRERGVGEDTITKITHDNPRKWLAGK